MKSSPTSQHRGSILRDTVLFSSELGLAPVLTLLRCPDRRTSSAIAVSAVTTERVPSPAAGKTKAAAGSSAKLKADDAQHMLSRVLRRGDIQ